MKIFDLEYQFYKGLRRVRSSYFRRKLLQRLATRSQAVRAGVVVLLSFWVMASVSPRDGLSEARGGVQSLPASLSQVSASSEAVSVKESEASSGLKVQEIPALEDLTAKAVYVVDETSGRVLLRKNENEILPPASITKVLTAAVVMNNYDLRAPVRVPAFCVGLDGSSAGLRAGEVWTVKELLYGMLVQSGSDAACALANHVTSGADFTAAMNLQARQFGLQNSRFLNPIGLDAAGHYSTARDLVKLGEVMMKREEFREIVATKEIELHGRLLESTNELLGEVAGLKGVKTGYTEEAGECLLFFVERNGRSVLGVILGSEDRFAETRRIIDWLFTD